MHITITDVVTSFIVDNDDSALSFCFVRISFSVCNRLTNFDRSFSLEVVLVVSVDFVATCFGGARDDDTD